VVSSPHFQAIQWRCSSVTHDNGSAELDVPWSSMATMRGGELGFGFGFEEIGVGRVLWGF
jgi:hypothetical protein